MYQRVIITAALAGAASFKDNNPAVPYTPEEFAEEAYKAHQAGAAMVHVHARRDDGFPTHEIDRIQVTYDAIRAKSPNLIVNLSSAVAMVPRLNNASPRLYPSNPKWPRSTPTP